MDDEPATIKEVRDGCAAALAKYDGLSPRKGDEAFACELSAYVVELERRGADHTLAIAKIVYFALKLGDELGVQTRDG